MSQILYTVSDDKDFPFRKIDSKYCNRIFRLPVKHFSVFILHDFLSLKPKFSEFAVQFIPVNVNDLLNPFSQINASYLINFPLCCDVYIGRSPLINAPCQIEAP